MSSVTDTIDDLIRTVYRSDPSTIKRMRLAVSPTEYLEIKAHMLTHFGVFYERIGNVPLIVEEDPENPPLRIIP